MPNYVYDDSTGSINTWVTNDPLASSTVQQMWEEWLQECEEADRVIEQKMREAEEECYQEQLRQEDMKKYPLFFWKETCRKDSD